MSSLLSTLKQKQTHIHKATLNGFQVHGMLHILDSQNNVISVV
jgi:hypothetical protein